MQVLFPGSGFHGFHPTFFVLDGHMSPQSQPGWGSVVCASASWDVPNQGGWFVSGLPARATFQEQSHIVKSQKQDRFLIFEAERVTVFQA